jgi:2-C-methyl-D-erythritol 2,4-cyclodiphosphate synthase
MTISHLSITMECLRPKISPKVDEMRKSIGDLLGISPDCVGITATTGEGLTAFGKGEGIMVFCILTVCKGE